jgi:hypothetical protein
MLIGNLVAFEHATQFTFMICRLVGLDGVVRRFHIATFALKVPVCVMACSRRMATVRVLIAFINILTAIAFHFIARLALAIVPKGIKFKESSFCNRRASHHPGLLTQIDVLGHP